METKYSDLVMAIVSFDGLTEANYIFSVHDLNQMHKQMHDSASESRWKEICIDTNRSMLFKKCRGMDELNNFAAGHFNSEYEELEWKNCFFMPDKEKLLCESLFDTEIHTYRLR